MNKSILFAILAVFIAGFGSGTIAGMLSANDTLPVSEPQAEPYSSSQMVSDNFDMLLELEYENSTPADRPSPKSRVQTNDIMVLENEVILKISNPEWAIFTDSKSMDPVIDSASKAIEIIPQSEEDIEVGDIVAYESKYVKGVVAHRVIEINRDAQGWYARMKGDNNEFPDPEKVRFSQIKRVVVAVIY